MLVVPYRSGERHGQYLVDVVVLTYRQCLTNQQKELMVLFQNILL